MFGVESRGDTPFSNYRPTESIGSPQSHIHYQREAVEIRNRENTYNCDGLSCTPLLWDSDPQGPPDSGPGSNPPPNDPNRPKNHTKPHSGSPVRPTRKPDPTASRPPPTATSTTARTSTPQSASPSLPSLPVSPSGSTTDGIPTGTIQSTAIETVTEPSTTSLTISPGSNNDGASTSSTQASEESAESTSTVVLTSTVISSANSYPATLPPSMAHSSGPQSASPSPLISSPESQNLSDSRRLSPGIIAGIVLGALALVLCSALALYLLFRRRRHARKRDKRASIESARRRLEPYSYDDDSSRPVSSVWSWFGSVSVDPDFAPPRREPSPHSLDFKFAEAGHLGYGAYSPSPSPCPSLGLGETQPLARDASSVRSHSMREGHGRLHLDVPPSLALGASPSSELLALAQTDYAVANTSGYLGAGALERSRSGVSRTTATSGDVQSVEAL